MATTRNTLEQVTHENARIRNRVFEHTRTHTHTHTSQVVAWLMISSMRSERVQQNMLYVQNVQNTYRKQAFSTLLSGASAFFEPLFASGATGGCVCTRVCV